MLFAWVVPFLLPLSFPHPPSIHTDWEQRKITFLNFISLSEEEVRWGKQSLESGKCASTSTGCKNWTDMGSRTSYFFSVHKSSHLTKKQRGEKYHHLHHKVIVREYMENYNEAVLSRTRVLPEFCLFTTDIRICAQLKSHYLPRLLSICPLFVPTRFNVTACGQHLYIIFPGLWITLYIFM